MCHFCDCFLTYVLSTPVTTTVLSPWASPVSMGWGWAPSGHLSGDQEGLEFPPPLCATNTIYSDLQMMKLRWAPLPEATHRGADRVPGQVGVPGTPAVSTVDPSGVPSAAILLLRSPRGPGQMTTLAFICFPYKSCLFY